MILPLAFQAAAMTPAAASHPAPALPAASPGAPAGADPLVTAGREEDARVARLAFRLATLGRARCATTVPASGVVFQHLSQFRLADRAGVAAAQPFDRGPVVIAVVPDGPAARAGVRAGDVLLAADGRPIPPEEGLAEPFDAARARARADAIDDLLATAPLTVALLRDGAVLTATIAPIPGCPSRVRLARSAQRNAFADERHVLLTTGLLAQLRGDDELAFVIAHEMAHIILGHAALLRDAGVGHGLGRTFGRSGRTVRAAERAADALGARLMLDAGLDPVTGAGVLARLGGDGLGIALFADHDTAAARIAAVRAVVAAERAQGAGAAATEPAR